MKSTHSHLWIGTPHPVLGFLAHETLPRDGLTFYSAVFVLIAGIFVNTDHATCDICSNRPHVALSSEDDAVYKLPPVSEDNLP